MCVCVSAACVCCMCVCVCVRAFFIMFCYFAVCSEYCDLLAEEDLVANCDKSAQFTFRGLQNIRL